MSCLLFLPLFLLLDLLKDANHFIGSLTLLKKGNEPKRVREHRLVCLPKLVLMRLGLLKEDFFVLLLHCGQLHLLAAIIEVIEELYSMPHEVMHWYEGRILGGAKPTN